MQKSNSRVNAFDRVSIETLAQYLLGKGSRKAGLKKRTYQLTAAVSCYQAVRSERNALLDLPTGTGKTLVSNLVARLWLDTTDKSVVVVVPRRVLVSQHFAFAQWMDDSVDFYHLSDYTVRKPARFIANTSRIRLLFTTPDLFANNIRSGLISSAFRRSVGLVVVDEFDEFLLPEFTEVGSQCRFDIAFQNFLDVIPTDSRFLLMSATSPLVNGPDMPAEVVAASKKVDEYFKPVVVQVPRNQYRAYIPVTQLHLTAIGDARVEALDRAIHDEISMLFSVLEEKYTGPVDRVWTTRRIDGLAEGKITALKNSDGSMFVCGKRFIEFFIKIRHLHFLRSFIYEDMSRGLWSEFREVTAVRDPLTGELETFYERCRLRGLTDRFEHYASLGGKATFLMGYCRDNPKTVFMFRYLRLLEAIEMELKKLGVPIAKLHGEMSDRQREKALQEFRFGSTDVLLMTRDTGKRGLDLPQAIAAVFYSPKASESSTFQEASRIRSTTSQVKECRILCYAKTDEKGKLQRLIDQILTRTDRKYIILDPVRLCGVVATSKT